MTSDFTDAEVRNAVGFIPTMTIQMRFSDQEAEKFDRWLARVKAEAADEAEATTRKLARDHNSLIREMGRVRDENRQLRDQVSVLTEARDLWREDALAADQRKQGGE